MRRNRKELLRTIWVGTQQRSPAREHNSEKSIRRACEFHPLSGAAGRVLPYYLRLPHVWFGVDAANTQLYDAMNQIIGKRAHFVGKPFGPRLDRYGVRWLPSII